ncbi:MAG: hypothetical protein GY866_28900 [Proteobacteria bacterium]|nr:hypothetical protein [Pseudomonadota bacterium]
MEIVEYNGWKNNVRLSNKKVELIVTKDVGPRIARFGFVDGKNLFAEIEGEQGETEEDQWKIRGGHRLWIAPEESPKTYELDNGPVETEEIRNGVRTIQTVGALSGIQKTMEIALIPDKNEVEVVHCLKNRGNQAVELAPWAISVMAVNGMLVVPLPEKTPHTERLTHNQEWSIWAYTDLSDPRWHFGSRYIFFSQDTQRGPNKLGLAHSEGWVAYLLDDVMMVKSFDCIEGARYPDGGVNFETFSNEEFLEMESLGQLTTLSPEQSVSYKETWMLFKGIPPCRSEADIDANVKPLVGPPR